MTSTATSITTGTGHIAPQQLTLLSDTTPFKELSVSNAPVQFRLSKTTRQRGLAHVAEIRRQLAEAAERRAAAQAQPLPPRHSHAA